MAPENGKENDTSLLVEFSKATKYSFCQPSRLHPAAKINIVGAPLILTYSGAHCIYQGSLMQRAGIHDSSSIPVSVALKWAVGQARIMRLKREADFYEYRLSGLRGIVTPQYYGFFTGIVEGVHVACMILEWCDGPPIESVQELNRQRMLAVTQLHNAGVFHGQLLDSRHFIPMKNGSLRIVDFSVARPHQCPGSTPLCLDTSGDPRPLESCGELDVVEKRFGVDAERLGRQLLWENGMYPELMRIHVQATLKSLGDAVSSRI
ncbi:hypothetical protein C8Q79DRAFT_1005509 [Trametes meyenii]|nr:hypothetical protein C8Q79DRAFT_1005509 [Trametes meyenii]